MEFHVNYSLKHSLSPPISHKEIPVVTAQEYMILAHNADSEEDSISLYNPLWLSSIFHPRESVVRKLRESLSLIFSGNTIQAISLLKSILSEDETFEEAFATLSTLYNSSLRDYQKALFYSEKLLKLNPNSVRGLTNRANAMIYLGGK